MQSNDRDLLMYLDGIINKTNKEVKRAIYFSIGCITISCTGLITLLYIAY